MKTPTMENRFRKLINARRSRVPEVEAPIETQGLPHDSLPIPIPQSPSVSKPDGRNQAEKRKPGFNVMNLRSFSYDSVRPGKLPTLGALPQKGNGPIKLQTSRRLSSGELVNFPQDSQRTLEDIREDGYIVGKKDKQSSPKQSQQSRASVSRPHLNHASHSAPSLQVPSSSDTWSQSPKSSNENLCNTIQLNSVPSSQHVGLGVFPAVPSSRASRIYDPTSEHRAVSQHTSASFTSTRASMRPPVETNATLKALRKAEYAKLVELYGSNSAAQNLTQYNPYQTDSGFSPVTDGPLVLSPADLEPLPLPPIDTDNRRSSHSSSASDSACSDLSSPQRTSYVSSVATGQTSIEDDAVTTRENIRKMIEQMRNSYLTALESQEPEPTAAQNRKSRKNKQGPSTSPTLNTRQYRMSLPSPAPLPRSHGRQTWHPTDADRDLLLQRRVNSHPPSGFGRLSPIQASPPRKTNGESGLKRADSNTLGALMGETTRSSIRSRSSTMSQTITQDCDSTARPETPIRVPQQNDSQHDSSLESHAQARAQPIPVSETTSSLHSRKTSKEFDTLFSNDLWADSKSAPMLQSLTLNKTYSDDSTLPTTPTQNMSRITSIPESPEFTYVAPPEEELWDNFI